VNLKTLAINLAQVGKVKVGMRKMKEGEMIKEK